MPGTNLTRDEAAARAALVDVARYEVSLDFTTGPTTFATTSRVHFTARTPGASTWVDFVGDTVQQVVLNGRVLDPSTSWSDSRIGLADLATDNELVVRGHGAYTNSGEGIHRFVDPVDDEVYLYSQFEVPDARRAFAVFEQPDLKASFTFTVRAPSHWTVVSNEPTPQPTPLGDGTSRWVFQPTPPLPSYVTAVCAGPYEVVRDHVQCRDAVVPLGLYSRRSLSHHVDADNVFDLTKKGLRYFEREFGSPYPFTKYDQLFVPEYNAGAMENAGCVTITEVYVFRGQAPEPLVERRAMTILHEIAHMWFGDLVTMRWWDDLWLNESFAEWAASACQAEATQWDQAWTTFHSHEKAWAYQQDQQRDTHPVIADMRDLHDVTVNFDGITYAKGGAVLKQLVSYVGRAAFTAGLHSYFRKHAWTNTTMADLFAELEASSGRDLSDWATRWLRTAGVNTLSVQLQTDAEDIVTSATVVQTGQPGQPTLRPHRLAIGSFALLGGRFERKDLLEVDVDGPTTPLAQLVGRPRPSLLLPNDADLTYAKVRLDPRSLQAALAHPEAFSDSLARSLVTGSLWELMRDGELAPRVFIEYLLRCIPVEEPRRPRCGACSAPPSRSPRCCSPPSTGAHRPASAPRPGHGSSPRCGPPPTPPPPAATRSCSSSRHTRRSPRHRRTPTESEPPSTARAPSAASLRTRTRGGAWSSRSPRPVPSTPNASTPSWPATPPSQDTSARCPPGRPAPRPRPRRRPGRLPSSRTPRPTPRSSTWARGSGGPTTRSTCSAAMWTATTTCCWACGSPGPLPSRSAASPTSTLWTWPTPGCAMPPAPGWTPTLTRRAGCDVRSSSSSPSSRSRCGPRSAIVADPSRLAQDWTSTADAVLTPTLQILGVLIAAIVLRWLLHRVIDRIVRSASQRRTDRIAAVPGRAGRALAGVTGVANARYVQRTQTMGAVLRSIVTILVATIALLMVMATLGIPLAPLLTSVGIGGLALGFGAQSLVKDFLSGIFMIVEDQYGVGDVIDTDTSNGLVTGTVEDVTLRVTMIRDGGGVMWYVRNGEITRVGNRSQGWSTATVDLPIAYTENVQRAIEVIKAAIHGIEQEPKWAERILDRPTVAGVESMSAGVVTIQVTARCSANENYTVQREIRKRVKAAFEHEGIDMAAAPTGQGTAGPG